jgi:hypothetical protein
VKKNKNYAPICGGVHAIKPKYRWDPKKWFCGGFYSRFIHSPSEAQAYRKAQDAVFKNLKLPALRRKIFIHLINSPYYYYYIHIQIIYESIRTIDIKKDNSKNRCLSTTNPFRER